MYLCKRKANKFRNLATLIFLNIAILGCSFSPVNSDSEIIVNKIKFDLSVPIKIKNNLNIFVKENEASSTEVNIIGFEFKENNFYGGHGIVGGQIPLGAGIAFGDKYHGSDAATLCYFGDGAARQGSLHETFNLAMLWKLPVVFICENNGYAMGTSVERTSNTTDIWKLGLGYEMPCGPVDGMDPVKVAKAVDEAILRARNGDGPTFLEMKTYRYRGHSMSDAQHYRTKDEVAEYKKIDPITKVKELILKKKYATQKQIDEIDSRVKDMVKECEKFAEESSYPEKNIMYDSVYEQDNYPFLKHKI